MTTNQRTWRRLTTRAAASATVLVLPILLAGPARAQSRGLVTAGGPLSLAASVHPAQGSGSLSTPPSLGGWNVTADGNAVDIVVDNTTGLAGIHPLSEADFPEAQSQFSTGFGSGLATIFWPGSAGGNFGSLSTELGFPSQLEPLASQLNDPIRASAQYPSGPQTAEYPAGSPGGAAVMQATAEPGGTTAEGSITDEHPSSILGFSSAKGTSSSTASSTAKAGSTTDLSGVSILGGLIRIRSIASTASATSDGTKGSGSASTHVSGVTVLGQKASIGSDGLVLPNFPSSLGSLTGPLVQNAISQVISGLGITVTEFPATESPNGAGFTATSGAVSVQIDPPSSAAPILEQAASVLAPLFPSQAAIIPTLPGLLQGLTVTITLGRATASADASPPFNANFNAALAPPAASGTAAGSAAGGSSGVASGPAGSTGGVGPSMASAPSGAGGSASSATGGTAAAQPASSLVNLSQPLAAGAVLLGVLLTLAAGYGLWRVGRMLLPSDHGPVCPLGQDQP